MEITSYESFCQSCQEEQGLSLLYLQHVATQISQLEEASLFALSTDLLAETKVLGEVGLKQDLLSEILEKTEESIHHLIENMRHKILREHVLLPVEKVREMDAYSLNWLSRRPGNTPRQKMANSPSIMAVRRRSSCNTAENQLFVAYLQRILTSLDVQEEWLSDLRTEPYLRLRQEISSHLEEEEWGEIQPWRNLPPNNTLLSDRYYRVIWSGWQDLEDLDDSIKGYAQHCDQRMLLLLKFRLLTALQKIVFVPQTPLLFHRESYSLQSLATFEFFAMDWLGDVVTLTQREECLELLLSDRSYTLSLVKGEFTISQKGKKLFPTQSFQVADLPQYESLILKLLDLTHCPEPPPIADKLEEDAVVLDLFSYKPYYYTEKKGAGALDGRLLVQRFTDEEENFHFVPCFSSNSILYPREPSQIDTFTFSKGLLTQDSHALKHLTILLKSKVETRNLTFLTPDCFNEFQLKKVKENLKIQYRHVESFPKSIALTFLHQQKVGNQIPIGACYLLVVDLVGNCLSFTLVKATKDEGFLEHDPKQGGLVWERHPCFQKKIFFTPWSKRLETDPLVDSLLEDFGLDGMIEEEEKLLFLSDYQDSFVVTSEIKESLLEESFNLTKSVAGFLAKRKDLVGSDAVTLVTATPFLSYDGELPFVCYEESEVIQGFTFYQTLASQTDQPLWRDNLPRLAIKTLDTSVELVTNQKITPVYGEVTEIPITQTITLVEGKSKYRFQVVKDDSGTELEYQAVVSNAMFPLSYGVECGLKMLYTYGAEEPYQLYFIPVGENEMSHRELRVSWSLDGEYDWEDLEYPAYPKGESTEELLADTPKGDSALKGYCNQFYSLYISPPRGKLSNMQQIGFERVLEIKTKSYGKVEAWLPRIRWLVDRAENLLRDPKTKDSNCYFQIEEHTLGTEEEIRILQPWQPKIHNDGSQFHVVWARKAGMTQDIKFYSNNFYDIREFHTGITEICYTPSTNSKGQLGGRNLCAKVDCDKKRYRIMDIKTAEQWSGLLNFLLSASFRTFYNGRTLKDLPEEMGYAIGTQLEQLAIAYNDKRSASDKTILFRVMCLLHWDMRDLFYPLAQNRLENYQAGSCKLPNEVGIALGDLTLSQQKELYDTIKKLKKVKRISVLSKGIWANESLVFALPPEDVQTFIAIAVDNLNSLVRQNGDPEDILLHLEFLLGVFRLRAHRGDEALQKQLSLLNPTMLELKSTMSKLKTSQLVNQVCQKAKKFSRIDLKVNSSSDSGKVYSFVDIFIMYMEGNTEGCDIIIQTNNNDK